MSLPSTTEELSAFVANVFNIKREEEAKAAEALPVTGVNVKSKYRVFNK